MDRDDLRESLETRARQRAREVDASLEEDADSRRPPRPGDLYALEETAEYAIEWLVLDRADVPSRVLLVPADTNPLAGSADVEIPPGHPLGPLTLRCGYGVWIDPDGLRPKDRTGMLDDATLEPALKKRWALARESLPGSPLEREVDVDPEYEDWVDEILVPARTALENAHREIVEVRTEETSNAPLRLAWGLAAALLFAVVGLSFWTASLYEAARLQDEPEILARAVGDVTVGNDRRGDGDVTIRDAERDQVVYVVLEGKANDFSTFRVDLVSHDNGKRWSGTVRLAPGAFREIPLRLPVEFVGADGEATLTVYGLRDGDPERIEEEDLRLVESQPDR